jgi:diphthamide biosynthesis methyltransferase
MYSVFLLSIKDKNSMSAQEQLEEMLKAHWETDQPVVQEMTFLNINDTRNEPLVAQEANE